MEFSFNSECLLLLNCFVLVKIKADLDSWELFWNDQLHGLNFADLVLTLIADGHKPFHRAPTSDKASL